MALFVRVPDKLYHLMAHQFFKNRGYGKKHLIFFGIYKK